jgi:hypothetical protein
MKFALLLILVISSPCLAKQTFGGKITLKNKLSLKEALAVKSPNKILTGGKVTKVCEKKGCWMTIKSENSEVRIKFKGYSFFVPRSISGKNVLVEGTIKTEVESVKEQRHLAKDAGQSEKQQAKITKLKTTQTFVATGVEVL